MDITYATARRAHASHNQEVYEHLRDETEYTDWIVTTAFYTAVHLVESHIFPFEEDWGSSSRNDRYTTLHEYHRSTNNKSLHESRDELVRLKMPEIHGSYRNLEDQSRTARYRDYKFPDSSDVVADVDECLQDIIGYMKKRGTW